MEVEKSCDGLNEGGGQQSEEDWVWRVSPSQLCAHGPIIFLPS